MELMEVLSRLKGELAELYGDRLRGMYLFGSRARDDAEPDSDVDVAVVLDHFDSVYEEISRMCPGVADLSLDADLVLTAIPIREPDWLGKNTVFLQNVRREAVSLP